VANRAKSYNQKLLMVKRKKAAYSGCDWFDFNPAANKAKEYATMQDSTMNVNVLPLSQIHWDIHRFSNSTGRTLLSRPVA
jgi:hypothetical protein